MLRVRRVSGVATLSLRGSELGSLAMPLEWTDWAPPGTQASSSSVPLLIDALGLVALAELVAALAPQQIRIDQ